MVFRLYVMALSSPSPKKILPTIITIGPKILFYLYARSVSFATASPQIPCGTQRMGVVPPFLPGWSVGVRNGPILS